MTDARGVSAHAGSVVSGDGGPRTVGDGSRLRRLWGVGMLRSRQLDDASPALARPAALLLLGVLIAGCVSHTPTHSGAPSAAAPTEARSAPSIAIRLPTSRPPYAVATAAAVIRETSGFTPRRGPTPARRGRILRTTFWYPTAGRRGPGDYRGGSPLRGPFPLVVFAHGFAVSPSTYRVFLHALAEAGLVVAAPLFPISGAGLPGSPREDDELRQAGDITAVINWVLNHGRVPRFPAAAVQPRRIAVIGHSDGAETVAAMLLYPTYRDRRVRAAVLLGGQAFPTSAVPLRGVPALVEQGDADRINPPARGRALYGQLGAPKAYLRVLHGGHLDALIGPSADASLVRRFVADFLLAALDGRQLAPTLQRLGNEPGRTRLASEGGWP